MSAFAFFADTYDTERLKTLSVWSQIPDGQMRFRPEPRARSPLEHMVHQCMSEDAWMRNMLGIDARHAGAAAGGDAPRVHRSTTRRCRPSGSRRCGRSPMPGSRSRRRSSTSPARARGCCCGASRTRHIIAASSPRTSALWGQPAVLDLRSDRRHRRPAEERRVGGLPVRVDRRSARPRRRHGMHALPGIGAVPPTERP